MTVPHASRPPDVAGLIREIADREIRCIIAGSVAAELHGVEVSRPGDLDIVPAIDHPNLKRLSALLIDLEAAIESVGHWTTDELGEWTWILDDDSPETIAAWKPVVSDLTTFDHLFTTRLGNFDVVPQVCGPYDELNARAETMQVRGVPVRVAHVDDLLANLTRPRRRKDVDRVRHLRRLQRESSA